MQHNMKTKCEIKKRGRVNNMYDIYNLCNANTTNNNE